MRNQSCHTTSHDIPDFQWLFAALGMKPSASAQDLAPRDLSGLPTPLHSQLSWHLGHPKNDFHFLKWARTSALGFGPCPSPLQGTFLPRQPPPVLILEGSMWRPSSRKASSATTAPRNTHTLPRARALCLPMTPATRLCHSTWLCPQTGCMLFEGRPHLLFVL